MYDNGRSGGDSVVKGVGLTVFNVSRKEVKEAIRRLQEALKEEAEDVTMHFDDLTITLLIKN